VLLSLSATNLLSKLDFTQGSLLYRHQHCQGRNELIIKAIGWRKNQVLNVFDLTAGLGKDAFIMAAVGCEVLMFERHPVVATRLEKALQQGLQCSAIAPTLKRMKLIQQCAIEYLKTQHIETKPDVIYCDPMFEVRPKTALVKKDLQQLQQLVGFDHDAAHLIELALARASKRVVVKRPNFAPPLLTNPHHSYTGRSHRFDVYIPPVVV